MPLSLVFGLMCTFITVDDRYVTEGRKEREREEREKREREREREEREKRKRAGDVYLVAPLTVTGSLHLYTHREPSTDPHNPSLIAVDLIIVTMLVLECHIALMR